MFYKGIKDYLAPSILANNGYEKVNNASGRFYASELEVKGIWGENYKKAPEGCPAGAFRISL
ncbi:MAG: hypothetical protein ACI9DJ_002818 [Algoriphagus sp.]